MYKFEEIKTVIDLFCEANNPNLIILHCVTDYPVAPRDVALHNIKEINRRFNVLTGYSDHTEGFHSPGKCRSWCLRYRKTYHSGIQHPECAGLEGIVWAR